jgi:hypothetical protein
VLPLLSVNAYRFHSFALMPGHVANVLGAYHGEKAEQDSGHALRSILKNIPDRVRECVHSYEIPNSLSFYAHRDVIDFLRFFPMPFNLMLLLAAVGAWFNRKRPGVLLISGCVFAYYLTMLPFGMFYRFRIPAVPVIAVLAAVGAVHVLKQRGKPQVVMIAVLLIGFFLTYSRPDPLRPFGECRDAVLVLIGNGHLRKAEHRIESLRKEGMDTGFLDWRLYDAYRRIGDAESASRIRTATEPE